MHDHHHMTNQQSIREYMLAGNATFTLRSTQSGTRFTYRVRKSEDGRVHFVQLLNGSDNTASYAYLGYICDGDYRITRKSCAGPDAPSQKAFRWYFLRLLADADVSAVEFWHMGHCGRCNRPLTVPESIDRGIGPDCAVIMGLAA